MQAQYGTRQTGKRLATLKKYRKEPDGLGEERISEGLTARSFLIKAIFASSPAVVGLDISVAVYIN
jgi:hypothetical protein